MTGKRREPIRVEAFVSVGGREENMDALPEEERRKIGAALKTAYLNALFQGKAAFFLEKDAEKSGRNE